MYFKRNDLVTAEKSILGNFWSLKQFLVENNILLKTDVYIVYSSPLLVASGCDFLVAQITRGHLLLFIGRIITLAQVC